MVLTIQAILPLFFSASPFTNAAALSDVTAVPVTAATASARLPVVGPPKADIERRLVVDDDDDEDKDDIECRGGSVRHWRRLSVESVGRRDLLSLRAC